MAAKRNHGTFLVVLGFWSDQKEQDYPQDRRKLKEHIGKGLLKYRDKSDQQIYIFIMSSLLHIHELMSI